MAKVVAAQAQICTSVRCSKDLEELAKAFPVEQLKPGTLIPYQDLLDVLKMSRRTGRFSYVIKKWRDYLLGSRGILMKPQANVGFVISNETTKVNEVHRNVDSIKRHVVKTAVMAASVDTRQLTDTAIKVFEHDRRYLTGINAAESRPRIEGSFD